MGDDKRFGTFEEFWPHYVREHSQKSTRMLHFAGTTLAVACLGGALLFRKPWLLLVAPVVGYGPAWIGHFFIEGNKPATFTHPLFSLRADFVMWRKIVEGTMDAEVARVLAAEAARATEGAEASAVTDVSGASHATVN